MPLIQIVVVLAVLGIAWYFIAPYIAEPFKTIATVIIVGVFCLWLLSLVGLVPLHVRGF